MFIVNKFTSILIKSGLLFIFILGVVFLILQIGRVFHRRVQLQLRVVAAAVALLDVIILDGGLVGAEPIAAKPVAGRNHQYQRKKQQAKFRHISQVRS